MHEGTRSTCVTDRVRDRAPVSHHPKTERDRQIHLRSPAVARSASQTVDELQPSQGIVSDNGQAVRAPAGVLVARVGFGRVALDTEENFRLVFVLVAMRLTT